MHQLTVSNPGNTSRVFTLSENGSTILKLRYNTQLHTARLESENEKRVFFIENEGLLKPRFIFKNEYGIKIGQMIFDLWSDKECIVSIDTKRFRFRINDRSLLEVLAYESSKKLVFRCTISLYNGKEWHHCATGSFRDDHFYSFIMALAWYLFIEVSTEKPEFSF